MNECFRDEGLAWEVFWQSLDVPTSELFNRVSKEGDSIY